MPARPRVIDVSLATFLRALTVVVLVWLWWRLWQWVLIFALAAFLAIALDPFVLWLERRGIRRSWGALLTGLLLVVVIAGFLVAAGAAIAEQTHVLGEGLSGFRDEAMRRIPPSLQRIGASIAPSGDAYARAARAFGGGLAGIGVAFIVTLYFLLDGRRTYQWLLAFAPASARPRVHATAMASRDVAAAYIRGNVITSVLCTIVTGIVLQALQVPAALVLALLAGLLDVVPVIGFILSAVPAILLALTVSPAVALGVALFYVLYNMVENYYIQPKVYGRALDLSDLAVIAAFLVGAELGGVLGAVLALPIAAMYPTIERLWFRQPELSETAAEHQRLAEHPPSD